MFVKKRGDRFAVYRSVRQGKQVRTQYIGSSLLDLAAAEEDLTIRIDNIHRRERDEEQERQIKAWFRDVEQVVRALLTIAGYHRHHRGQWRRRTVDQLKLDDSKRHPLSPAVQVITDRMDQGDFTMTSKEARQVIQAMPEVVRLYKSPPAALAESILQRYYPSSLQREVTRDRLHQVQTDLAGPNPTPMESLLAERAAVCWLAVNEYERAAETTQGLMMADAVFRQRKIDGAHRRFLSALRTLATVRKLQIPDFNINLDQRSVHMGNQPSADQVRDIPSGSIEVG